MTDTQPTIVDIGTVAASNIVQRLKLDAGKPAAEVQKTVETVKSAIRDEIQSMSSHFSLAVHDARTQYEAELYRIRSAFSYVKANKVTVAVALGVAVLVGVAIGVVL